MSAACGEAPKTDLRIVPTIQLLTIFYATVREDPEEADRITAEIDRRGREDGDEHAVMWTAHSGYRSRDGRHRAHWTTAGEEA